MSSPTTSAMLVKVSSDSALAWSQSTLARVVPYLVRARARARARVNARVRVVPYCVLALGLTLLGLTLLGLGVG